MGMVRGWRSPKLGEKTFKELGEKPINIETFGQDSVRDKQDLSLGQTRHIPGTNRDRPWDNRPSSVELKLFNSKLAILSRLSMGRVGFGLGTIVP